MFDLVLIVEDEADIASTLAYSLEREGFRTRTAPSGEMALDYIALGPAPDIILLDLMLPGLSGVEVCKRLKADERTRAIPIIVLSARTDEIDRVVAFELGADDYVTKPFSVRELLLRVKGVLRYRPAPSELRSDLTVGELRLSDEQRLVWFAGKEVALTPLEYRILSVLAHEEGRVFTRERLLQEVWGGMSVAGRTIDTHVRRAREKLGPRGAAYVQTVRGVGYRLLRV